MPKLVSRPPLNKAPEKSNGPGQADTKKGLLLQSLGEQGLENSSLGLKE